MYKNNNNNDNNGSNNSQPVLALTAVLPIGSGVSAYAEATTDQAWHVRVQAPVRLHAQF